MLANYKPTYTSKRLYHRDQLSPLLSKQGRPYFIRPGTEKDLLAVADFFSRLSDKSRYLRFMSPLPALSPQRARQEAVRALGGNLGLKGVLLATIRHQGWEEVVAVAELYQEAATPYQAEFAVAVRDDYQGEGIGTTILRRLVQLARQRGVTVLQADLLTTNRVIPRVAGKLEIPFTIDFHGSEAVLTANLSPTSPLPYRAWGP